MKLLTKQKLEDMGYCTIINSEEPNPKHHCDLKCLTDGASNSSCNHINKTIVLPLDVVWDIVQKLQSNKTNEMKKS